LLGECLSSLLAQTRRDFETILVDNGSSDGSVEFVRSAYPAVRVVENRSNAGYAAGSNAGAKAADSEIIVMLNNDTKAAPDWLEKLLSPLKRDPTIGAVGSKLLFYDDTERINSVGTFVSVLGFSGSLGDSEPRDAHSREAELFAPSGGAVAIRKKVFAEIGGLYEPFFLYEDDVDLGWKVWNAGYRVVLAPDAIVYHKYSRTQRPYKYYYLTRNKQWSFWKNAPARELIWLFPAGILFSLALAASFAVTLRWGNAWQVMRGLADGVRDLPPRQPARNGLAARHYTGALASMRIMLRKFSKHVG